MQTFSANSPGVQAPPPAAAIPGAAPQAPDVQASAGASPGAPDAAAVLMNALRQFQAGQAPAAQVPQPTPQATAPQAAPQTMSAEQLAAAVQAGLSASGLPQAVQNMGAPAGSEGGEEAPQPGGQFAEAVENATGGGAPVTSHGMEPGADMRFNAGVSVALRDGARITPVTYRADQPAPSSQAFAGQAFAQFVRCLAASARSMKAGTGYQSPVQFAQALYGESHPVTAAIAAPVQNTVDSSTSSKGAVLIPPSFSSDFIKLLRPAAVFLAAGPRFVDNARGNLAIPKQSGGASAGYIGEGDAIPVTQAEFGMEQAVSKHIAALTVISNTWLDRTDPGTDQIVIDDLVAGVAQKVDQVGLRSTGAGGEPKGCRYWANVNNVFSAETLYSDDSPAVVARKVETILGKLWLGLFGNNISATSPVWFCSARTYSFLYGLRDGNGRLIYRDELKMGMLRQMPIVWSNQIPDDLGSGSDSELMLVNMDDVIFADEKAVSVDMSESAIQDGANVRALFSHNQMAVRVMAAHDIIVRYSRAVAVATGINWGAELSAAP